MESQECSHNKPKHNTSVIFKQTSATLYSLIHYDSLKPFSDAQTGFLGALKLLKQTFQDED